MTSAFKELGVSNRSSWGSVVYVEDDPSLRGMSGIRTFDKMRRTDPTGIAMYGALSLPIRKVAWSCKAGGDGPLDEWAAEFAWECFEDMSLPFSDVISDVCLIFPFGWAFFEMVLKRRKGRRGNPKSQYDDGLIGFKKIALRPQSSLAGWDRADDGDVKGMKQYNKRGRVVDIGLDRSLLFRTSREGDDPEGFSVYRPAVRPWKYRRKLERVEGIGLYRRWAGFPTITLPDGATSRFDVADGEISDEQRAEELVQAIYEDRMMGAYLPAGWVLGLGGPEGAVDATMGETIVRKDSEMARAILAQFLLLGLRSVGTQALADTLLESFMLSVEAYLESIRQEFNRYAIPYLFNHNMVSGDITLPELVHTSPRSLDLTIVSRYLGVLAGRGMVTSEDESTENFLRSLIPGMPPAPIPVLVEEPPPPPKSDEGDKGDEGDEGDDVQEAVLLGASMFQAVKPPSDDRPAEYHQLTDANAEAQRGNLEGMTDDMATAVGAMGPDTTEAELRETLDDFIMAGLLIFRERSMLDIGVAFWLGFGKPSGGPEQLIMLQQEVSLADSWLGYNENGTLRRTNPAGKPTLFGDIAGTLEGRIAAILLLLKEGKTDEAMAEITGAVRTPTRNYSRGSQYSGHVWHSIWQGVHQREVYDVATGTGVALAVRWVNDPAAAHCVQCLIFGADPPGREYPSWDAMEMVTNGILPGFGTDCDGYCRCHLERPTGADGSWHWA